MSFARTGFFLFILLGACLGTVPLRAVTAYPYGSIASNASDAHVTAAYNTWKTRRLVANSTGCANSSSVNNGGGTAYSEGMGYGMLMAAYLEPDDTQLLKFWNFYWGNRNANNVMNWAVPINNCSNNTANGATDADLDVAAALIRASRRWPASANNWSAKATTVLNAMYTAYRDSCNGLKNGDAWGGCSPSTSNDGYNPSYLRTGYLRSYDCFEGGTRWDAVRTRSYNILNYSYTNYALPPDWVHSHAATLGQFGRATNSGGYGYDSCRTPWSLTQDYLWWNNTTGRNWANKIANNFKTKGGGTPLGAANDVGDDYNYSTGAKVSNNHNNEFIGGIAVSFMADPTNSAFLSEFYSELVAEDDNSYFSDSLKVIYLMILTGVFQEPCNGGGPVGTNTASPTRTPSFTPSPTPTPAFGLSKTASASSAAVGAPFTYYIDYYNLSSGPDTVGVRAGVSLEFHNSNAGASGSRTNVNYRINNASGSTINLASYRIRYFHYDATHTVAGDYASYEYNDASGQGTGSVLAYTPAYTGGPRNANMEQRIVFAGGTLATASTVIWEGAMGSMSDGWTMNHADDWSYPGSVGTYSAANAAAVVLEENVAGTWKLASGSYPGGSAGIANVTITDVLDSRVDFVSALPAGGAYTAGTRTYSITLASVPAGGYGRISLTAQFNGTAIVGNVVGNSAGIAASGYPSRTSNNQNVTVAGAANTPSSTVTPTSSATRSATPSSTRTGSPTVTSGSSATSTSTVTVTRSTTPTPSRTATPSSTSAMTASYTASMTATRTGTATLSPGNSPTYSATVTATASRTATGTISPTRSSTQTITLGSSPTFTTTATTTATRSATTTRTPSPTISLTFTDTSTITAGPSPTHTPSFTVTGTPSRTATVTLTRTAVDSPTATASATPVIGASTTPTMTPFHINLSPYDHSLGLTPVIGLGGSFFASDANRSAYTWYFDADNGAYTWQMYYPFGSITSDAAMPYDLNCHFVQVRVHDLAGRPGYGSTSFCLPSRTPSPTRSVTRTMTATASATPSVTPSLSSTATSSATPSFTQTSLSTPGVPLPTDTHTATSANTATAQDGPNQIDRHASVPNPWDGVSPGFIMAHLAGRADKVTVRFYTKAMVSLGESIVGAHNAGWCRLPLPVEMFAAPSGTYYYVVQSERAGQKSLGKSVGTLLKLR